MESHGVSGLGFAEVHWSTDIYSFYSCFYSCFYRCLQMSTEFADKSMQGMHGALVGRGLVVIDAREFQVRNSAKRRQMADSGQLPMFGSLKNNTCHVCTAETLLQRKMHPFGCYYLYYFAGKRCLCESKHRAKPPVLFNLQISIPPFPRWRREATRSVVNVVENLFLVETAVPDCITYR